MKNKISYCILLLMLSLSVSLISAGHVVTNTSTFASNYNTTHLYNITISNTDLNSNNITQVNITLPSGLRFDAGTNGTNVSSATVTFTNTSVNLIWSNTTSLINNQTIKLFWFNATSTSIGSMNISIGTTNSSGVYSNSIIAVVSDVVLPTTTLTLPNNAASNNTNANDPALSVTFIGNFTDDYNLSTSMLYIWSSVGVEFYTQRTTVTSTTNSTTITTTLPASPTRTYNWNFRINDSSGNVGWAGSNRTYIISTTTAGGGGGGSTSVKNTSDTNNTKKTDCCGYWVVNGSCQIIPECNTCPLDQTTLQECIDSITLKKPTLWDKINNFITSFIDKIINFFKLK